MAQATFDIAQKLDLYFRIERDGHKTLTFTSEGLNYDISGIAWEFNLRPFGAVENTIELKDGVGLSVSGNEIAITVTAEQTKVAEKLYFWELLDTTHNKTWLCGNAHFTSKDPVKVNESINIMVNTEPDVVNIEISSISNNVNGGTP
jgi:hypothetical protein